MLDASMTTPALLFPAISLLLLAYTNRFLTIGQLTRSLYKQKQNNEETIDNLDEQLRNMSMRISLIRWMQAFGVMSFMICTLSMGALMMQLSDLGFWLLACSIGLLFISLCISLHEVLISGYALRAQLRHLEAKPKPRRPGKNVIT